MTSPYESTIRREPPTKASALRRFFADPIMRFVCTFAVLFLSSALVTSSDDRGVRTADALYESSETDYGILPLISRHTKSEKHFADPSRNYAQKTVSVNWLNIPIAAAVVAAISAFLTWFFHPLIKLPADG